VSQSVTQVDTEGQRLLYGRPIKGGDIDVDRRRIGQKGQSIGGVVHEQDGRPIAAFDARADIG
jgi:hypothetical protein